VKKKKARGKGMTGRDGHKRTKEKKKDGKIEGQEGNIE